MGSSDKSVGFGSKLFGKFTSSIISNEKLLELYLSWFPNPQSDHNQSPYFIGDEDLKSLIIHEQSL